MPLDEILHTLRKMLSSHRRHHIPRIPAELFTCNEVRQGVGRRDLGNEMRGSNKPIGHDLARYSLVRLNRIRTGYGRFNANMNQMGLSPSASCECGATDQTAQHIASECPLHRCKGDLVVLDTAARNWLHDLQCDV